MDLQQLFSERIVSQYSLGGVASEVWLVKTEANEYIVRSSGVDESVDAPFLWACRNLFGIELSHTFDIEHINNHLKRMTNNIAIPSVLCKGVINGRQFIVVEKMHGTNLTFLNKPSKMLEHFGNTVAEIHSHKVYECGSPNGTLRYPLDEFPQKLSNAIRILATRYYPTNKEITECTDYYCSLASKMPVPKYASYIMLDMDPRQFLSYGERVSAIVDTEAYVLGPREMELIAIESSLDEMGANSFRKGYCEVLPFPDLSHSRALYRFLFCLLEIKGPAFDYQNWISMPRCFNSHEN